MDVLCELSSDECILLFYLFTYILRSDHLIAPILFCQCERRTRLGPFLDPLFVRVAEQQYPVFVPLFYLLVKSHVFFSSCMFYA